MSTPEDLELQVMAHRYRYYVMADPIISDYQYDLLERQARAACRLDSPVHKVGSCLPASYTKEQIAYAENMK